MSMLVNAYRFATAPPASGHRYWRLLISGVQGTLTTDSNTSAAIFELEMRTTLGGGDVTGSGTASASSVESTNVATRAFDNSNTTGWFSAAASALPAWLAYDFGAGSEKSIVEIAVTGTAGAFVEANPRDLALQWSDDNSAWTTLFEVHGEDFWGASETRVFSDPGAPPLYSYAGITDAYDILGANLKAWYPSDLVSGSAGDQQARLHDYSGQSKFGRQVVAAQRPTLVLADLGGRNTLRYTASDNEYFAVPHLFSSASAGMAALVIKLNADPPGSDATTGLWRFGSTTGASSATHFPYTDGNIYDDFLSTTRKTAGNPASSLASTYRIIVVRSTASNYNVRIDGTSLYSTATNTFGAWKQPTLGRSLKQSDGSRVYFNGWIAEAIFADTVSNYEQLEGYLAHKWFGAGASNNLPAGHPYKTTPP